LIGNNSNDNAKYYLIIFSNPTSSYLGYRIYYSEAF
jgi:hypothetical protein